MVINYFRDSEKRFSNFWKRKIGNKSDKNIPLIIEVTYDSELIEITFSDSGTGFVMDEVPDPTTPENILKGSGRGIHIMRSFLDDLKYNFSETGTNVTLVLKLK